MSFLKKSVSLFLVTALIFTSAVFSSAQTQEDKAAVAVPTVNIAALINLFKPLSKTVSFLASRASSADNGSSIIFEEGRVTELCNYIFENSGLDIIGILKKFPVTPKGLEAGYMLTGADTTEIREAFYKIRYKYDEEQNFVGSLIFYFLGAYISVIKEVRVYAVPYGDDGTTRAVLDATFMDGSSETLYLNVYFSPDGLAYGENKEGILSLGYECSVYDLLICATENSWMRSFGFCLFYDVFCYITPFFNYETRRFKFDYGEKEWMVQVWKGNYLIANGAEVGLYNRKPGSVGTYYDCYDSTCDMTLKLNGPDGVIYDISANHWWINGFKLARVQYSPKELNVEFSIILPDEEMAKALENSILNHYKQDVSCTVDGCKVSCVW